MNRAFPLCTLSVALLATSSCGGEDSGSSIRDECNPLGGPACMMPWPSSVYLAEDPDSPTGYRVALPAEAMPVNADLIPIDPASLNEFDGFAIAGAMLVDFPTGVSADGLPPHTDIAQSMEPDASIVVVNMTTGERLPIFAEPDMNAAVPEERALIIRPMVRMDSATRYAVGVRNTVKAADGSALPVPEGFARILEGKSLEHPLGKRIEPGYDAIFSSLDAAGLPKDELVLAWDFVTASDEFLTEDLMAMRSQALVAMDDEVLTFELADLAHANPENVQSLFAGTYQTPMFMDDVESDTSLLVRDAEGLPALQGLGLANVAALIPKCVETATLPLPVIMFGHGMFGNAKDSIDSGFLQEIANDKCAVVVGGDWIGLTDSQFASVAYAMNDINRGTSITEKLAQGIINFIALQRMIRGPFLTADEFSYEGMQIIDPERIYYLGGSLGGILGGVFMAFDPDITRGALGVPGGPWSLLFERSVFWPPLRITMKGAYPEPWDYQQNVALIGMHFEKVDPITTSTRVVHNPLPDTPAKQILMYSAVGDALVSNIASDVMARSIDIPLVGPSVLKPYGLVETTEIVPSGYQIYDEVVDVVPPLDNALQDFDYNETHQEVHDWAAVQRQIFRLLSEGEVANECRVDGIEAPCDCTTGACL